MARTTPGSISVGKVQKKKRAYLQRYKYEHGCMDCGERDLVVLEFDHREPAKKNKQMRHQQMANKGKSWQNLSWPQLLEEVEKCDVVCANCHRRRTARQQGWAAEIPTQPGLFEVVPNDEVI